MIFTKHTAINIKKVMEGFHISGDTTRPKPEPSSFQTKVKIKYKVSDYNADAGKLPL